MLGFGLELGFGFGFGLRVRVRVRIWADPNLCGERVALEPRRLEQLCAPPRVLELGPQPRLGFGRGRLGLLGCGRVVPRGVLG